MGDESLAQAEGKGLREARSGMHRDEKDCRRASGSLMYVGLRRLQDEAQAVGFGLGGIIPRDVHDARHALRALHAPDADAGDVPHTLRAWGGAHGGRV